MTTTSISIKTTKEKKEKAEKVAKKFGMSLDSVVESYLDEVIRTKELSYQFHDEEPSPYLKRILKKAEENYKKGNTSPAFKTGEEAVAWLEKTGNMIVRYDPEFFKYVKKLDVRIRKATKKRLLIFTKNANDPVLHNHTLKYEWKGYHSINITSDYRALYLEKQEGTETVAYFVALGTHEELYLLKN